MVRALGILTLIALAGCRAQPADPDLRGEEQVTAQAKSLDEAADEAARVVEDDMASTIKDHQAEAAAAAAAIYAGQEAQPDGSGRVQPGDRTR